MNGDLANRLTRAQGAVAEAGIDALLLGPSADLTYLTGFSPMPLERLILAIIPRDERPSLIVPALEAPGAERTGAAQLMELIRWSDGSDPYAVARELLPGSPNLAVGDTMWASHLLGLQAAIPSAEMIPSSDLLSAMRAVKDTSELELLERAGEAADRAFDAIAAETFTGRTERDIASSLSDLLVEHGHDSAEFEIVASGSNSASPHHQPNDRGIGPGDAVVLDFGGAIQGYFSDTTRTVVVQKEPAGFSDAYAAVSAANEAAFRSVVPGVPAQDVDRAARTAIADAGFAEAFIHRTGHGIGLELHEAPYIVEGNETRLEPGMTFSIEPGIYLNGRFGVRIEDIVVVTDDGARRLNRSDRRLRLVG